MNDTLSILLMSICVCAVSFGISYLIIKYKIKKDQYKQGVDMAKLIVLLTKTVLQDTSKFSDKEVEKISNISLKILDYMNKLTDGQDRVTTITTLTDLSVVLCIENGIELDDDKLEIIKLLVSMLYDLYEDNLTE